MQLIRPVQVKGKYPDDGTSDRATYGYVCELTGYILTWFSQCRFSLTLHDRILRVWLICPSV